MPGSQLQHAWWQFPRCQLAKMAFDGRTQIGRWIGDPDRIAAEANGFSFTVRSGFNADRIAAQENLRSNRPNHRFPRLCLEPLKLAFQPGGMAFDKLSGHRRRAAARNRNAGGAIGSQTEQIPACALIAYHQQRQRLRPHRQVYNRQSRRRPGSENPFKQHGVVNRGLVELAMVVATPGFSFRHDSRCRVGFTFQPFSS
jgi:hypothetical protein